jgi:hypothetical protein
MDNAQVNHPGLEARTLALKDRKDGFTQGLGFVEVSPFFFAYKDVR